MRQLLPRPNASSEQSVKSMQALQTYIKRRLQSLFGERARACYCLKHHTMCPLTLELDTQTF
eukprot:1240802-Lingulodinium_polyedra.AAC.1